MMKKQIPLEQLKPGMFLLSMDQSWWNTPFLVHHRFIKNEKEIEKIRQSGVQFVVIDTAKSMSAESSESHAAVDPAGVQPSSEALEVQQDVGNDPVEPAVSGGEESSFQISADPMPSIISVDHHHETLDLENPNIPPQMTASHVRTAAVRAVQQVFEGVRSGEPIDHPLLEKTAHAVVQQVMGDPKAFPQLILVENLSTVDKHLYSHAVDVCALGVVLGIEMGLEEQALQSLAMGGLLHDIGYIRLPRNLVRNRKQAGEADQLLLAKHSEVGHAIVISSGDFPPDITQIVLEHHERLDGSGAPHGLAGEGLSFLGQIIGLVDQFDKLTSNWGLGPMCPAAMVLRNLYQDAKNGQFPLRPIERLIQCLGVYPLGSLVELSTGEQGIVIMTNPLNLLKPKLKLIVGADHLPYSAPLNVDLACPIPGEPDRSIRSLLDANQEQIQVEKYLTVGV